MNKKMVLVLLMIILCGIIVEAKLTIVPIEYEIDVMFEGERDFRIVFPNGKEKHFYWAENVTHSDESVENVLYYELQEEVWCSESTEKKEYENITTGLISMLGVCSSVVSEFNNTQKYVAERDEALRDRDIYEKESLIYKDKWEDDKNASAQCLNDLSVITSERDKYKTDSDVLVSTRSQLSEHKTDLDQALKDKSSYGFFGFLLGGAAVFFYLKQKNKGGSIPSEQSEVGQQPNY